MSRKWSLQYGADWISRASFFAPRDIWVARSSPIFQISDCSSEVISLQVKIRNSKCARKMAQNAIRRHVNKLLSDRFATVYGNNKASDFESIIQDVKKLKTCQDDFSNNLTKLVEMLEIYEGEKFTYTNYIILYKDHPKRINIVMVCYHASFYEPFIRENCEFEPQLSLTQVTLYINHWATRNIRYTAKSASFNMFRVSVRLVLRALVFLFSYIQIDSCA